MYYLYYQTIAFGNNNASAIHVASSPSMEPGTWTDHGILPLPVHNTDPPTNFLGIDYNLIDANLLVVDQGSEFYLSLGSYFDGLYQIRMKDPLTIMPGAQPVHLVRNTTQRPDSLGKNSTPLPPDPVEGSFQFAWPVHGKTHFFLFFSSGTCCGLDTRRVPVGEEYKVMVFRSIAPTGPFVDKEGKSCLLENGGTEILGSHGNVYAPG